MIFEITYKYGYNTPHDIISYCPINGVCEGWFVFWYYIRNGVGKLPPPHPSIK